MTDAPDDTTVALQPLRRRLFGYHRMDVDILVSELQEAIVDLHHVLSERTEELEETQQTLARVRQELRYWNDRQAITEQEMERARNAAERVEREARTRAGEIESEARERSLRLIDRVSGEAEAIIQNAREEAQDLAARLNDEHSLTRQRITRLQNVQKDLHRSLRDAVESVEDGLRSLDSAAPSALAVVREHPAAPKPASPPPAPAPHMNFGRGRAVDATHSFSATVIPGGDSGSSDAG